MEKFSENKNRRSAGRHCSDFQAKDQRNSSAARQQRGRGASELHKHVQDAAGQLLAQADHRTNGGMKEMAMTEEPR